MCRKIVRPRLTGSNLEGLQINLGAIYRSSVLPATGSPPRLRKRAISTLRESRTEVLVGFPPAVMDKKVLDRKLYLEYFSQHAIGTFVPI